MALLNPEAFVWVLVVLALIGAAFAFGKANHAQHSVPPKSENTKKRKTKTESEPTESNEEVSVTSKKGKKKEKKKAAQNGTKKAPAPEKKVNTNSQKAGGVRKTKNVPRGTKGVGKPKDDPLPEVSQAMAARTEIKDDKKKSQLGDFHWYFSKEKKDREPAGIALQFGLLYKGTEYALEGCVNDLKNVHNHFLHHVGFKHENIILMTDDTKATPTKKNMESAMKALVRNAIPGDRLFLQYSGHGTEVKDKSRDEADGFDEALCPLDGGVIIDDWLFINVIKQLERVKGASLFVLVDACHSGTCLDLQNQYYATRGEKPSVRVNADKNPKRASHARVLGFSAALDSQTATDIQTSIPQGAFTEMFLEVFRKHQKKPMTYRQFLLNVDGLLAKNEYAQQASFSTSEKIDLDSECRFW